MITKQVVLGYGFSSIDCYSLEDRTRTTINIYHFHSMFFLSKPNSRLSKHQNRFNTSSTDTWKYCISTIDEID